MPDTAQPPSIPLEHPRKRSRSVNIDRAAIAERIKTFYDTDNQERADEIDARLQRYAKFRMWREGKEWPWAGCTDFANPDMMTACMRVEDTLVNATMSNRPTISAKALKKGDQPKCEHVDQLLDYQFYVEQPGEQIVGNLADDFVLDGLFTAYVPWIDERRSVREIKIYPMVPADKSPLDYFAAILNGLFPRTDLMASADGWSWKAQTPEGKRFKANFWTRDEPHDDIELELEHEAEVYCGPRVIRCDLQDILHPARCENLQIKSPSNPTGAAHVLKRDFPSIDEINRLWNDGYYDLMTAEEAEKLDCRRMDTSYQEREEQKDIMQGHSEQRDVPKGAESHKTLTRIMCFDSYDINGDGMDEDVIFWFLLEPKIVLRARYLTQMFPSNPPRRPFGEAQLFPVPGRRYAIGMLEMMEGVHDLTTQTFNQMGDAGTIANSPFGFYRPTGNMRNETIRMSPGELYALGDPKNDVSFPNLGNQSQTFGFNMVALLGQVEEKLTNIGDLQLGRVPKGKASALRTVSGMQTVLAQGDARPERVLRRFFMGLTQIWQQMHTLNQTFLPKGKQFLITGYTDPEKDPYGKIGTPEEIQGDFLFTFSANVLNTSKEATAAALDNMIALYVTPLALQLKIIDANGVFRLFRDKGRAVGQDPDRYLTPPTPGALEPPLFYEDALDAIMSGRVPVGKPAEGVEAHLAKINEFIQGDDHTVLGPDGPVKGPAIGMITGPSMEILKNYLQKLGQLLMAERQQTQLSAAAAQLTGPQPDGMQAQPGAQPNTQQAPMQPGELQDESLPGAGGGANQAGMM